MWLFDWRIFRRVHMIPCPSKGSSHGLMHTVPFHWSSVHYCRNTDRKRQLFKHMKNFFSRYGGGGGEWGRGGYSEYIKNEITYTEYNQFNLIILNRQTDRCKYAKKRLNRFTNRRPSNVVCFSADTRSPSSQETLCWINDLTK